MASRSPTRDVRGILLLDKPAGLSSNQALQRAKRLFQAAKAGHTGSLDPLATGMLPIGFGAATRVCSYLLDAPKRYAVTAELGVATDTADAQGTVIERRDGPPVEADALIRALAQLHGEIEQVPPMYSALKRSGVPLYRLARRGVEVPREARRVTIHSIELDDYRWPDVSFTVSCSKGTYVRTLVTDLAAALCTVGHVRALRRLAVEPFPEDGLRTLETLEAVVRDGGLAALDATLLPADSALPHWPKIVLDEARALRLVHGQSVAAEPGWPGGWACVYARSGELLALGEIGPDRKLSPRRVLAAE